MPGCCLVALLLFFGPRVVLALAWVFTDWFQAFPSSLLGLAGFILLPWSSLAWMYTFFKHGGVISALYAVIIILAVMADLGAYGGGGRYRAWRSGRS